MEKKKVVEINTQPAQTSVKELRKELKELKDTLLSVEKGTDEYNEALAKSAEIQHTLKEQMEEINASAMDFGQIASNCTKAVGGMVAGFQAATAVMNLFGIENEDVLQSLKKMQSLMALTQSFGAIDAGIKAFRRLGLAIKFAASSAGTLKTALVSTGIGALVVAVGALAANWDKVTAALQKYGIISEKQLEEDKKRVDELREKVAQLHTSYEDWERKQKESKLNEKAKKEYDELGTSIEGLEKKFQELAAASTLPENMKSREVYEAKVAEANAVLDNVNALKKQQQAILDNEDSYKKLDKTTSDADKKLKEMTVDLGVARQEAEALLNPFVSLQEQLADKSVWEVPIKVTVNEDEESEEDDVADGVRKRIESVVEGLRNSFITEQEQYDTEVKALKTALNTKLISQQEYNKLSEALAKEHADKQKQIAQSEITAWVGVAQSIAGVFDSLTDLMQENSEEAKSMQIMAATINMLAGITAAIAGTYTTHTGWWDWILAGVQAASIATTGAIQIAKIAKTTKDNALSMSKSSTSTPSTTSIASINAPVQYTQDVQGANIERSINDISGKVYVTETDITDTQNRVRVTETESRF